MTATIAPAPRPSTSAKAIVRSVDLSGPAGRLEAMVNEGLPDAPFAALVCHPHPLGGGTLHNKVVYHAMKVLNDPQWGLGWPVLRFNFRGTGLSEGTHDGDAEIGDVAAALAWLENEYKRPVVAVGFSFGAAMVLRACCGRGTVQTGERAAVHALVALGLPIVAVGRDYRYPCLASCALPKLFLSGDDDRYAPSEQWTQVAGSAAEPKRMLRIPGADHFFTGHLEPMQQALAGWLQHSLATWLKEQRP